MLDIVQGTEEWFEARLGKVTASRVADVIAKTNTGWGAGRANYAAELVAERLTGKTAESYTNAAMQWGTAVEPMARLAYEVHTGAEVEEVGFVDHPVIPMTGASPDGLVGQNGLIEIKAPNTSTHIDTLLNGTIPAKYITQMHWQMACTGRIWCDFVSFDPRLPENMRLFVQRIYGKQETITELEELVAEFLLEIDQTVIALIEKYGEPV